MLIFNVFGKMRTMLASKFPSLPQSQVLGIKRYNLSTTKKIHNTQSLYCTFLMYVERLIHKTVHKTFIVLCMVSILHPWNVCKYVV